VRNTTVQFNSLGGNLIAALKLGELIRQAHLDTSIGRTVFNENGSIWSTTVDGVCVSACAYAFIGGEGRLAGGNGKYGVHQFYDAKAVDEPAKKAFSAIDVSVEQILAGLVLDYVLRMGVDAKLISLAEASSPWDMRYLTAKELSSFRIDNTGSIDTGWRIDARDGGAVLETRSSYSIRPAVTVTLLCRGVKTSTNLIIASSTKYLDRWLTEGYGWPRPPNVQQIRAELHGLSISGPGWQSHLSAATIGSVEIDSERRIRVSVNLPPDVLKNLSAGGHIVISFDFPDEYASFLYADIASSLPPQVIELVLRNCTH
jgi:hypothetical protein